ncbi:MAG TPA: spore cortex biosynthesis protein YabQ [Candidatus Coproplasma excrementipullorum]|nr:spore cortex biosynthesis protein YabQ [Candidatus Coproplasma excrementipullorum]
MSQITIFFICAACGIASGVIYEILYCLRAAVRTFFPRCVRSNWAVTFACDVIYLAALAAILLSASHFLNFYALRVYQIAALALGALIYLKSLHIIVAFFVNKVYNKISKKYAQGVLARAERRKAQKNNRRGHSGGRRLDRHSLRRSHLPDS